MTTYRLVLKNLRDPEERITLEKAASREYAEQQRKSWRRILGGKNWEVDRRPDVDTLDFGRVSYPRRRWIISRGRISCLH